MTADRTLHRMLALPALCVAWAPGLPFCCLLLACTRLACILCVLPPPSPEQVRGAIIHVIGDFVQSVGVAIAGGLIWWHQVGCRLGHPEPEAGHLEAGPTRGV